MRTLKPSHRRAVKAFRSQLASRILPEFTDSAALSRDLLLSLLTRGAADLTASDVRDLLQDVRSGRGRTRGELLAMVLSALGPGFEKLGQLMGNRPDLVNEPYRSELAELSERAKRIPFREIERAIESTAQGAVAAARAHMGGAHKRLTPEQAKRTLFTRIESEPLGVGSIGQAHLAELANGQMVVIKVLKPGARARLHKNFEAIRHVLSTGASPSFARIVKEMHAQSDKETDLRREAASLRAGRQALGPLGIHVPRPVEGLVHKDMLVMELARGEKLRDAPLEKATRVAVADDVFASVVSLVFFASEFHADLHRGNVFVTTQQGDADGPGAGALSYIDWGLTGSLAKKDRFALVSLLAGVALRTERISVASLQLMTRDVDVARLRETVQEHSDPSWSVMERAQGILLALEVQGIEVPTAYVAACKALLLADGTARRIDPEFRADRGLIRVLRSLWPSWKAAGGEGLSAKRVLTEARSRRLRRLLADRLQEFGRARRDLRRTHVRLRAHLSVQLRRLKSFPQVGTRGGLVEGLTGVARTLAAQSVEYRSLAREGRTLGQSSELVPSRRAYLTAAVDDLLRTGRIYAALAREMTRLVGGQTSSNAAARVSERGEASSDWVDAVPEDLLPALDWLRAEQRRRLATRRAALETRRERLTRTLEQATERETKELQARVERASTRALSSARAVAGSQSLASVLRQLSELAAEAFELERTFADSPLVESALSAAQADYRDQLTVEAEYLATVGKLSGDPQTKAVRGHKRHDEVVSELAKLGSSGFLSIFRSAPKSQQHLRRWQSAAKEHNDAMRRLAPQRRSPQPRGPTKR